MEVSKVKNHRHSKKQTSRGAVKNSLPINRGYSDWSDWEWDEAWQREWRSRKRDDMWEYEYRYTENIPKEDPCATSDEASQEMGNPYATDVRPAIGYPSMPVQAIPNYGYSDPVPLPSSRSAYVTTDHVDRMPVVAQSSLGTRPNQDAKTQRSHSPEGGYGYSPAIPSPLNAYPDYYASLDSESDDKTSLTFQSVSLLARNRASGTSDSAPDPAPLYDRSAKTSAEIQDDDDDILYIRDTDSISLEEERTSKFKVRRSKDFEMGKVFKIPWWKPLDSRSRQGSLADIERETARTKLGLLDYAVRRFVVVEKREGHSLCLEIRTYGGQATTKYGLKAQDHCIIYTEKKGSIPMEIEGEPKLMNRPIQVVPLIKEEYLEPASRLNYAKIYTVEDNVKVQFIGEIHRKSMKYFIKDYNRIHADANIPRPAEDALIGVGAGVAGIAVGVVGTLAVTAAVLLQPH